MPAVKGQSKADVVALKLKFLDYYREVPIQKMAAQWIRRDESTISEWKAADPEFRDAVKEMEALFVSKNLHRTKADWKLERIFKDLFSQRQEVTGANGSALIPILASSSALPGDDSDQKGPIPQEAD